jgi:sulfide:quinone oxidoreductase
VRDKADLWWISNEYALGDFGMGGLYLRQSGFVTPSKVFTESLFAERGIHWITRAHVTGVDTGRVHYETLDGAAHDIDMDFAMLLPPFSGVGITAFDRSGVDITPTLFMPNGFMRVDADYTPKPYEQWSARDWPRTYQSPAYANIFAAGIAFAPPHAISRPHKTPGGTPIAPARRAPVCRRRRSAPPSRVQSPTCVTARPAPRAKPRWPRWARPVASAGANLFTGTAASMTVFPIVPDFETYPDYGRDLDATFGEIGLAGHWIKVLLHHAFLYKAQMRPGWSLIPE